MGLYHLLSKRTLQWLFVFSGTAMATQLLLRGSAEFIGLTLSGFVIALCILCFRYDFLHTLFDNTNKIAVIASFIASLTAGCHFTISSYDRIFSMIMYVSNRGKIPIGHEEILSGFAAVSLGGASFFAIFVFYLYFMKIFYPYIIKLFDHRKVFFRYSIWMLLIAVFMIYLMTQTSAFSYPTSAEGIKINNAIFGTDGDFYTGMGNHLMFSDNFRHPLFSVVFIPVTGILFFISYMMSLWPGLHLWITFSSLYCIVQGIANVIIALIIYIQLKGILNERVAFWGGLFYLSTFPVLLFSILVERFSLENLLVISFLYIALKKGSEKESMIMFSLAAFSVISSVAIYPMIFLKDKICTRKTMKALLKTAFLMAVILVVFGRVHISTGFYKNIYKYTKSDLNSYAKDKRENGFDNKFLQYLSFESGIFFAPNWQVIHRQDNFPPEDIIKENNTELPDKAVTQAFPQKPVYYLFGAFSIITSLAGFVLNRKEILSKASFYWFLTGFALLGLLGLGSTLNEMYLYSSYFSWPQVILSILLMNKLIKSNRYKVFMVAFIAVGLLIINILTLADIAQSLKSGFPPIASGSILQDSMEFHEIIFSFII